MLSEPLGAHLPWSRLDDFLTLVLDLGLTPEIAFKGTDLDNIDLARLAQLAQQFAQAGMHPTIHAPFLDLNPGALDPLVRQITRQRLLQTLQIADQLNAHLMVVHPGFDHWRYPGMEDLWLEHARAFFLELLEHTANSGCRLAIENIYETSPGTLTSLVDSIHSPRFGHCFDIGHWHLFGQVPMGDWLTSILPRLFHLHLHDNCGSADEHLPVGDGEIDFKLLFSTISSLPTLPSVTLEAHRPEDLVRSLRQTSLICFS
ncbi:MAG: sugar phosphate isomerase/epimerase [Desulfuromonadales bacterium]|nr:sugar phosphate isomerase/epimerase [Desulfuromonadales bacterium]